jgi:hypothetical protein
VQCFGVLCHGQGGASRIPFEGSPSSHGATPSRLLSKSSRDPARSICQAVGEHWCASGGPGSGCDDCENFRNRWRSVSKASFACTLVSCLLQAPHADSAQDAPRAWQGYPERGTVPLCQACVSQVHRDVLDVLCKGLPFLWCFGLMRSVLLSPHIGSASDLTHIYRRCVHHDGGSDSLLFPKIISQRHLQTHVPVK